MGPKASCGGDGGDIQASAGTAARERTAREGTGRMHRCGWHGAQHNAPVQSHAAPLWRSQTASVHCVTATFFARSVVSAGLDSLEREFNLLCKRGHCFVIFCASAIVKPAWVLLQVQQEKEAAEKKNTQLRLQHEAVKVCVL